MTLTKSQTLVIPPVSAEKRSHIMDQVNKRKMILFTCTYYCEMDDLRLHQCIKTLTDPKYGASHIPFVVVDGSPPDIHEFLKSSCPDAIICKEQRKLCGKGGALREAAMIASSLVDLYSSSKSLTDNSMNNGENISKESGEVWLCWQEAEKSDMNRCWMDEVLPNIKTSDNVIIPSRENESFQNSYPIEQFHSESYGNLYLNCIMKKELENINGKSQGQTMTPEIVDIDWHFGPFAFRRKLLNLWVDYKGTSYDAQVVPVIAAIRKGYKINSGIEVTFKLDEKMKEQEEGSIDFIEKRLYQLNDLDPKVKRFWKKPLYC